MKAHQVIAEVLLLIALSPVLVPIMVYACFVWLYRQMEGLAK